jgi:hypothetical protein
VPTVAARLPTMHGVRVTSKWGGRCLTDGNGQLLSQSVLKGTDFGERQLRELHGADARINVQTEALFVGVRCASLASSGLRRGKPDLTGLGDRATAAVRHVCPRLDVDKVRAFEARGKCLPWGRRRPVRGSGTE